MSSLRDDGAIHALDRPHEDLLKYYVLRSLILGPFFPVLLIPSYLRFRTLRYRFDDEGISMRWGILFRREISLTYSRIQDIHLASNAVERFLGLARIQIQTASGSSSAEITIEGLKEFDSIRDFLYTRMRGARAQNRGLRPTVAEGMAPVASSPTPGGSPGHLSTDSDELARILHSIADEVAALRTELAALNPGGTGDRSRS